MVWTINTLVQELGSLQGLARLASRALDLMDLTGPLLRAAIAQVSAQPALLAFVQAYCRSLPALQGDGQDTESSELPLAASSQLRSQDLLHGCVAPGAHDDGVELLTVHAGQLSLG